MYRNNLLYVHFFSIKHPKIKKTYLKFPSTDNEVGCPIHFMCLMKVGLASHFIVDTWNLRKLILHFWIIESRSFSHCFGKASHGSWALKTSQLANLTSRLWTELFLTKSMSWWTTQLDCLHYVPLTCIGLFFKTHLFFIIWHFLNIMPS